MANPNIVNVGTIYGNSYGVYLSTTVNTAIVSNPSGSGSIYKINSVTAANINTTASSIYMFHNRGLVNTHIAYNIVVAANSTQVVMGKDTTIYLLENDNLYVYPSAANYLQVMASWEQIS